MDLIPIPQEAVQKTVKSTKSQIMRQIRARLKQKADTHDTKILQKTCLKMSEYLVNSGRFTFKEVDALIDDMYRSILPLQKRKQQLQKRRKK